MKAYEQRQNCKLKNIRDIKAETLGKKSDPDASPLIPQTQRFPKTKQRETRY